MITANISKIALHRLHEIVAKVAMNIRTANGIIISDYANPTGSPASHERHEKLRVIAHS